MVSTVKVPAQFEPLFAEAEKIVGNFFSKMQMAESILGYPIQPLIRLALRPET